MQKLMWIKQELKSERKYLNIEINNGAIINICGGLNGRLTLSSSSILCNSVNTWSIGSARRRHIDGDCQMADNRIHHSGGINAGIGRFIPPAGFATGNLGSPIVALNAL